MIDLTTYPKFRTEALSLKSNIGVMLNKMDGVLASTSFTDAAKGEKLQTLVNEYLP